MVEPISAGIGVAVSLLVQHAPDWLHILQNTLLDKGKEVTVEKAKERWHEYRDGKKNEKDQLVHLEIALKKAAERGLVQFVTLEERDQYKHILTFLSQPGPQHDMLCHEALRLFTISDSPNFSELAEKYNLRQRISSSAKHVKHEEVDTNPYLSSFFKALITELYADPFFRQQMSNTIEVRAAFIAQHVLPEVASTLHQIRNAIVHDYTSEQLTSDLQAYAAYIEKIFRRLKMAGIVLKDKNPDPELNGIFVPIRGVMQDHSIPQEKRYGSIITLLERYPYLVLLGGPGSGKSTVTRHLAWSHALANLSNSTLTYLQLLSGNPLPLRIELRRLTEDRRQHPGYNFLSYTMEVLLQREGIEINAQMFKNLLEQKRMLLLFDGLDEVATLDDRKRLVEDIEHFAEHFPGNRILVTSRPVGYDLARISNPQFSHAQVEEFNDDQIRYFLERWYTYVLRLSPIPHDDQQELETLFKILKENQRLHKLAVNPLLLTVITALHRYERLPDRRVLIYDSCANLLLETWAKLKGTDTRWKDMKMVKDDQYACVAHLGFVLHERSQKKEDDSTKREASVPTDDIASDVPTRFMLHEIERFLKSQKLITEVGEQRAEADRFLKLIQEEAGLIVERGKDESGEDLYGFVHRTFQEYFAAADVYERFQQETDLIIISDFLREHLHDPHWREVILLLLGKLKRTPVTNQLRQVLDGKIKSHRSQYTDIVQQDLFFICDCLTEEIVVESELAEVVVSRLSDVVKSSQFPSQCEEALSYLGSLTQTRQYASQGQRELVALVVEDSIPGIVTKIEAAKTLYNCSSPSSKGQQQACQTILELAQRLDLSVEQQLQVIVALYESRSVTSEERLAYQMLLHLIQRSDLSIMQLVRAAKSLTWYGFLFIDEEGQQEALQKLLHIAYLTNLSFEEQVQVAEALFLFSLRTSVDEGRREAYQMLLRLSRNSNLSLERQVQVAKDIYRYSSSSSEEKQQAYQTFFSLTQHPDLSIEQKVKAAKDLYRFNSPSSEEKHQSFQMFMRLIQHPDLSIESQVQVIKDFPWYSLSLEEEQQFFQMLLRLTQHPNLSIEHQVQVAKDLYKYSSSLLEEERALQMLSQLAERSDLSIEHQVQIAQALYKNRLPCLERQQGFQMLSQLAERSDLSFEHQVQIAETIEQLTVGKEQRQIVQLLLDSVELNSLSVDQQLQIVENPYRFPFSSTKEGRQIVQLLLTLSQRSDLSIEQKVQVAIALYSWSSFASSSEKELQQQPLQMLLHLAQRSDLSVEQQVQVSTALYQCGSSASEEERQAADKLLTLSNDQVLTVDQRLKAIGILVASEKENYSVKLQAIQILLTLLEGEALRRFVENNWQTVNARKVELSDIKLILKFASEDVLPIKVRDEMYLLLRQMVPEFGSIQNLQVAI